MADTSEESVIASAVVSIISPEKLSEILNNETNMITLKPLIADVVSKAASIDGLREEITNLFETKTAANPEFNDALKALQKELNAMSKLGTGGRKRRRTNKRKNYKKRRTTKRR